MMYREEFVTEITKSMGRSEKDLPKAAKGIAELIMKDATNYQLFGAYWWAVKRLMIKHLGVKTWFTKDYMDEITLNRAWHGTELRTISAAIHYQQEQIMITPSHFVLIDGEEESYTLYDEDAGF